MQRLFLNNPQPPTMKEIKANWPILFEPRVIEWHFEKLMGQNLCNIDKMFEFKKSKLIEFGLSKKYIEKNVADLGTDQEFLLVFQTISKYFGENINILINQWTTKEDDSSLQISAPCIVILTEEHTVLAKYYIFL